VLIVEFPVTVKLTPSWHNEIESPVIVNPAAYEGGQLGGTGCAVTLLFLINEIDKRQNKNI
jgi:hypothetical protein